MATKLGHTLGHALADSSHPYVVTVKEIDSEPDFFDARTGSVDVRRQIDRWRKRADVEAAWTFEIGPQTGTVHAHALVRSSAPLPIVSTASVYVSPVDSVEAAALYAVKDLRDPDTRLGALALNGGRMYRTTKNFWPQGSYRAQRRAYNGAEALGEMGA